jgi:ATP-dependent DNA helicase DinG
MSASQPSAPRVALAHLFATGVRGHNGHGLVHLGLLPLVAEAEPQTWLINPQREFAQAVRKASQINNDEAKAAPAWQAQRAAVQAAFADYDALLVMDRAGARSPERQWLEEEVLAGMVRAPVCIALDELLAFFLPGEVLDDAEELKAMLLADKVWEKASSYKPGQQQLPVLLLAMRRALRRVLATVLHPGPVAGLSFPVLALLREALTQGPRRRELRAFRLLAALCQQPDCCDEALPAGATTRQRTEYRLPRVPQQLALTVLPHELLAAWLREWHPRSDGVGEPEMGMADDLTAEQVDAAFAALRAHANKEAASEKDKLKPREKQQAYARFVAQALNKGGAYAVEAGTGTGKTFGYLVPVLEYLRRHPTAAVIVATSTKNLQDQMHAGELPALLPVNAKGVRTGRYAAIRTALLKGKNGYLCAHALAEQFYDTFSPALPDPARALAWLYLALRLRTTQGELDGIARPIERLLGADLGGLRFLVEAERNCRHGDLLEGLPCVYKAHRLRAENANLVITNHHKLLSLPRALQERAKVLVVDEADRFPDNFRSALARDFSAHNLVMEVLLPLLGHSAPQAPLWPSNGRTQPPEALLPQLASRLQVARQHFYRDAHATGYPRPTDEAAELAFELLAEAQLEALTAEFALRQQVADALADTPLASDAQLTAEAAWLARQAAAEPIRQRQAVRAVQAALPGLAGLLSQSWEELLVFSGLLQAPAGQPADLPFPLGETHWLDRLNWAPPAAPPRLANVLTQLRHRLAPLNKPLAEATALLQQIGPNVVNALRLADPTLESAADDAPPSPDQILAERVARVASRAQELTAVLARLLAETPVRDFIPILERLSDRDPLAWSLRRQPHCLWPYLVTPDPAAPRPLQLLPGELAEAFVLRRQAARQRLGLLPGEPVTALYEAFATVVFTSATLYVEDSLDYFRRLLDQPVPFADSLRLGANFDYTNSGPERVVAGLAAHLPHYASPLRGNALDAWRMVQCRLLLALIVALEGRTLVLFTSNADLDFAARYLASHLPTHDIELLRQNGASQWEIRRFGRVEQSVLLGVDRFWTGVDFAGPTLAQVVVWRAPVPSLGEPLAVHRVRYLTEAYYWKHFGRPAARLKLRQGFGRLVRREKDRGTFIVLDARLSKTFLADLLLELPLACEHHLSAEELLGATTRQVLPLLSLGEEFRRRNLTLEKLLELADG